MSLDTPCEVVGVGEIKDGVLVPFIVVRMRNEADGREKFLLKTGESVSWEVNLSPAALLQRCYNYFVRNIAAQLVRVLRTFLWRVKEG